MKAISEIIECLNRSAIPYFQNVDLSRYCSFKIGGICPLIIEPQNEEMVLSTLNILDKFSTPYKLLGGGTNLLISDHPDFIVVRLGGDFKQFKEVIEGNFWIGSAQTTTPVFRKLSNLSYRGLEFLTTIPGWIGGAVVQNAGCYGGEIFDWIESVSFIQEHRIYTKKKSEIQYSYRNTEFLQKKDCIILGITLRTERGNLEEIQSIIKANQEKRNSSQPKNKKSAGSVFKNPSSISLFPNPPKAWKLIDEVGLRGFVHGGAKIAEEHCNFIVNVKNAKATDVDYLICTIQEKVFQKTGIHLEKEIEYFGLKMIIHGS